ncbi:hypothetical protein ACFRCI_18425 [Streptomyces sp. NPDC056638]|uniref:hypothetical protein n=1 Tax=Streptomyces sp. NPDC056638 TaxID=3345887 RepID=UPI003685D6A9
MRQLARMPFAALPPARFPSRGTMYAGWRSRRMFWPSRTTRFMVEELPALFADDIGVAASTVKDWW